MTTPPGPARADSFMIAGGCLAIVVSISLLVVVLHRDVGLNYLNGWTILLGASGGVLACVGVAIIAVPAIIVAMLPALFGGIGIVYIPSIVLIIIGATRKGAFAPPPE